MTRQRNDALTFLNAALGIWLGIHAFRTYIPTAVWNLSDQLPLYAKGAIAIVVHLVGLLGCALPFTRRPAAAFRLAAALAIVSVLRQIFLGSDALGSAFSLLGWIIWLWWFAAFTRTHAAKAHVLAPAVAAGFATQVGLQGAMHGIDLPMARGPVAIIGALLIAAAFVATALHIPADHEAANGNLGLVAFGPVFFLEVTLLANPGRIGFLSGLALVPAALLIEVALIAVLLLLALPMHRSLVFTAMLASVAITAVAARLSGSSALLLVPAQMAMLTLLHAASARRTALHAGAFAGGAVLSFLFVFLFYNRYEWPLLWPAAALVIALCAWPQQPLVRLPHRYAAIAFAAAALCLIGLLPHTRHAQRFVFLPRTGGALKALTYNIHQGFDNAGVPGIQRIADEIEKFDADLIALQEVGRGWTLMGGSDLVAYLQYRFPQYQMTFLPLNGQLLGVALLSRLPARFGPGVVFAAEPGVFRYGYVQADIALVGRDIHFVGVHLTAGLEGNGGAGRADQMTQLIQAQQQQRDVVIMGDFNAQPTDPPIRQILGSGYTDASASVGLGGVGTWPAVNAYERDDYMFLRGNVQPVRAVIPHTTASDHLPLLMLLK